MVTEKKTGNVRLTRQTTNAAIVPVERFPHTNDRYGGEACLKQGESVVGKSCWLAWVR